MCNGNLFRKVPKLGKDPHTNEFADTNFTRFLNNSPTIHSSQDQEEKVVYSRVGSTVKKKEEMLQIQ